MQFNGPYVDQHPDALRLSLVEGSVDLTRLLAIDARTVTCGTLQLTATIIGSSHVLNFVPDEAPEVSEVLACIDVPGIAGHAVCDSGTTLFRRDLGSWNYTFSAWYPQWINADTEPDELRDLVRRATAEDTPTTTGFMVEFPKPGLAMTPKTVIVIDVDSGESRVSVSTAHSYPNVPRVILSTTTLIHHP